jgi:hypothetical protein
MTTKMWAALMLVGWVLLLSGWFLVDSEIATAALSVSGLVCFLLAFRKFSRKT